MPLGILFFGSGRFQPTEKGQNKRFEYRRYDIRHVNIVSTALKRGNYCFYKGFKALATKMFYTLRHTVIKPIIPLFFIQLTFSFFYFSKLIT